MTYTEHLAEAPIAVQDTSRPFQSARLIERRRITDRIGETIIPSKREPHQFTFPPAGQKLHPMRTDQMVYEDGSNREQGKPPSPTQIVRENKTRTSIPDISLQELTLENEALDRWLDDGGTLESCKK